MLDLKQAFLILKNKYSDRHFIDMYEYPDFYSAKIVDDREFEEMKSPMYFSTDGIAIFKKDGKIVEYELGNSDPNDIIFKESIEDEFDKSRLYTKAELEKL